MRKTFIFLLTAVFLIGIAGTAAGAVARVTVNDKEIIFDSPPVMIQGRVLVSIRPVMEAAGADVFWNDLTETVTVTRNGNVVRMKLGGGSTLNEKELKSEVPLVIIKGRLMAPLRFIGEALQMKVDWNSQSYVASITSPEKVAAEQAAAAPPPPTTVSKDTSNPMEQPNIPGMLFMTGPIHTVLETKPDNLQSALTERFSKQAPFGDYVFLVPQSNMNYCEVRITMNEALGNPSGWRRATQAQKEAFISALITQIHVWYPDARIDITVRIEGERSTAAPAIGETVLRTAKDGSFIVSVSQDVGRGNWDYTVKQQIITVN